jgi:hypothetical protein
VIRSVLPASLPREIAAMGPAPRPLLSEADLADHARATNALRVLALDEAQSARLAAWLDALAAPEAGDR